MEHPAYQLHIFNLKFLPGLDLPKNIVNKFPAFRCTIFNVWRKCNHVTNITYRNFSSVSIA